MADLNKGINNSQLENKIIKRSRMKKDAAKLMIRDAMYSKIIWNQVHDNYEFIWLKHTKNFIAMSPWK